MSSVHVSVALTSHQLYTSANAEQRAMLAADVAASVATGVPEVEVLEALNEYGTDADKWEASYRAFQQNAEQDATTGEVSDPAPCPAELEQGAEEGEEQEAPVPVGTATAERAAEEEAQQRAEASATLKECGAAFRKGERALRAGHLESGRLASLYVAQRKALGDKREVAIDAVKGELSKWASDPVKPNDLIAVYHAYRLLAEEPGLATQPAKGKSAPSDVVPYGHYRDAYRNLVQRQNADEVDECWVLLPGVEQEARDLFARAVKDRLSLKAVQEQVKALQAQYAALQRQSTEAAARQATEKAKQDAIAAALAREQRQQQEAVVRAAEVAAQQAATQGNAEEDARVAEQARLAREDLARKQQEERDRQARAEEAAREQAKQEKAAKEAAERQRKAEEAAAKKRQSSPSTGNGKPTGGPAKVGTLQDSKPVPPTQQESPFDLLSAALEKAQPATAAEILSALILEHTEKPEDVLERVLRHVVESERMPRKLHDGLQTLLASLSDHKPVNRVERRAGTPSANGTPAAAAA